MASRGEGMLQQYPGLLDMNTCMHTKGISSLSTLSSLTPVAVWQAKGAAGQGEGMAKEAADRGEGIAHEAADRGADMTKEAAGKVPAHVSGA